MMGIDQKVARSAWAHAVVYVGVLLLICVIWVIRKTLLVFATALMFAYLLYPLVDAIDRRLAWKTRTPALALPFALILGLFTIFGMFIKDPVRNEIEKLHHQITQQEDGKPTFTQQVNDWKPWGLPVGERIVEMDMFSEIMANTPGLKKALGTSMRYLGNLFVIPILSFFLLKDGRRIRDAFLEMLDSERKAEIIMKDAHLLLLEYMRALLFLCLSTLIIFTIALNLMRVKYSILLALIAFPLEFVPLVGPLTSAIIIIGASEFNGYPHLGWLIAFLIAYRLFQDYVLSPHLMKKGVNLHPLLVMFGVFAGGEIGGVPGIFLSVPVLALSRLIYYELRKSRALHKDSAMVA